MSSVVELFQTVLARRGDDPAVYHTDGTPALRFHEIDREAGICAQQLKKIGAAGRAVALRLPNRPDWPAYVLGIWKAGAAAVLLPTDLGKSPTLAIHELLGCAAEIIEKNHSVLIRPLPARGAPLSGFPDAILWKITSGTTSTPRAIAFSAAQLHADARNVCSSMGITPADINFGAIPFSHSYGFSNLITPLLFFGIPLVACGPVLPYELARALESGRPSVWPSVPALISPVAALGLHPPPTLRLVISAGARLPLRTAREWLDCTGLPVHSFYGSSECGGICYDREGLAHEIEGWVGTPMENVGVDFLPAPDSPAGEGALRVHGDAIGLGILPPGADYSIRDGCFFPADLLVREGDGFRITGRLSEVIHVAGKKVSPVEIESALLEIPGVREAAVFGIPSGAGRGEEIAAAIVGTDAPPPDSLRAGLSRRLPAWKIPRRFFHLDSMPVNSRGKLPRRELAGLLAETTTR